MFLRAPASSLSALVHFALDHDAHDDGAGQGAHAASPARRRFLRPWVLALLLALAGGATLIIVGAIMLSQGRPSWWRPMNLTDAGLARTGQSLENSITSRLSQVRPGASAGARAAPWTITISQDEASAWLNTRLSAWAQSVADMKSWPRELAEVQAHFDGGRIDLAFRVVFDSAERIVTARVAPRIDEHGALWMEAESFAVGRLPLPRSWVLGSADEGSTIGLPRSVRQTPQAQRVARALAGEEPIMARAEIKLPDGRRVEITGLEAREGHLVVTCRTVER